MICLEATEPTVALQLCEPAMPRRAHVREGAGWRQRLPPLEQRCAMERNAPLQIALNRAENAPITPVIRAFQVKNER